MAKKAAAKKVDGYHATVRETGKSKTVYTEDGYSAKWRAHRRRPDAVKAPIGLVEYIHEVKFTDHNGDKVTRNVRASQVAEFIENHAKPKPTTGSKKQ